MAARISPRLIELTYEAALKSFWRKEALRKFLRASHLSEAFLSTWSSEDSKRDFLDRVFQKLQMNDRARAVIFEMARSLSEQTTFPDLRNWEDSPQKIADATKAVAELKKQAMLGVIYHDQQLAARTCYPSPAHTHGPHRPH